MLRDHKQENEDKEALIAKHFNFKSESDFEGFMSGLDPKEYGNRFNYFSFNGSTETKKLFNEKYAWCMLFFKNYF